MAEQAQPAQASRRVRPEVSAWLMLLTFFIIFCALVAAAGLAGWRYYTDAMAPLNGIGRIHARGSVGYRPPGSAKPEIPPTTCPGSNDVCFEIEEGGLIEAFDRTGVGPVGSIVLQDQSQIDLYAHPTGTVLTMARYRVSRWNQRLQEVAFQQSAGYARYDVRDRQPYESVRYSVTISDSVRVLLEPGGSYSIKVPGGTPGAALQPNPTSMVEVAVRSGSLTVVSGPLQNAVHLRPGEMLSVATDGTLGEPLAAHWNLVADGDFTQHATEEYNAGTATWTVSKGPGDQDMRIEELNGTFRRPPRTCPPQKPDICKPKEQVYVGQFRREGAQAKTFITAIEQNLDADVSEFTRSLRFSAYVRVLSQSVPLTGVAGSECPLMLVLTYRKTSLTDEEQLHRTCFYSGQGEPVKQSGINYVQVPQFYWYPLDIELRDDPFLKDVRYLQKVRIEARGHDYLAEITAISLIGKQ